MMVTIKAYDKCKYDKDSKKVYEQTYDIDDYEIVSRTDNEMYDDGFDEFDTYGEYLILKFVDGTTGTFRNSFVDMFSRV